MRRVQPTRKMENVKIGSELVLYHWCQMESFALCNFSDPELLVERQGSIFDRIRYEQELRLWKQSYAKTMQDEEQHEEADSSEHAEQSARVRKVGHRGTRGRTFVDSQPSRIGFR
jgi:hypothetical protein